MKEAASKSKLRSFYWITITQVLSLIGSRMTGIALGIWIFDETGNSTPILLASFFSALPLMFGGSFAGVLVDRWNRRTVLIFTDAVAAFGTFLLLLSFLSGTFELWQLYVVSLLTGFMDMFQRPAMEASITMLVPEKHRDRANALRQITGPAAGMIAPVITGFAYIFIGVTGVMWIDLATFAVAAFTISILHIPQPQRTEEGKSSAGSVLKEFKGGIKFLLDRRVLIALMLMSAVINFLLSGPVRLSTPYILTLTGSKAQLGLLLGTMNAGIVLGGILVGIFGGTRPRVHGIMIGLLLRAVFMTMYGFSRTPLMLGISLFFLFFTTPLIDASFMSIVQSKVPPDMQGRIFSILFQLMYIANPLSLALTGPLVDKVLEPAVGSSAWSFVAPLVGDQAGSGMGLLMVAAGVLMFVVTAILYAWPKTRSVESDLPDYEALAN